MSLVPGCPRCATPVARHGSDGEYSCPEHGVVRALWRPDQATYEGFVDHLGVAGGFPTYLPWPLGPGWLLSDFGVVHERATLTSITGTSELDGPVDIVIVAEEPGTGLGIRVAGTSEPGGSVGEGLPSARVRVGTQPVPLWPLDTADRTGEWDRSVLVGEAGGRWLWLVLRPASALLMLRDEWILREAAGLGMALVEVPFGPGGAIW